MKVRGLVRNMLSIFGDPTYMRKLFGCGSLPSGHPSI